MVGRVPPGDEGVQPLEPRRPATWGTTRYMRVHPRCPGTPGSLSAFQGGLNPWLRQVTPGWDPGTREIGARPPFEAIGAVLSVSRGVHGVLPLQIEPFLRSFVRFRGGAGGSGWGGRKGGFVPEHCLAGNSGVACVWISCGARARGGAAMAEGGGRPGLRRTGAARLPRTAPPASPSLLAWSRASDQRPRPRMIGWPSGPVCSSCSRAVR